MNFLSSLISGLSLGSVYAIIALGYTMVYGISKMLNFAHGDIIMIGAYVSFIMTMHLGIVFYFAVEGYERIFVNPRVAVGEAILRNPAATFLRKVRLRFNASTNIAGFYVVFWDVDQRLNNV